MELHAMKERIAHLEGRYARETNPAIRQSLWDTLVEIRSKLPKVPAYRLVKQSVPNPRKWHEKNL